MVEVKVLVEGKHEKQEDRLMIGSSVVLIKSNKNLIVDTGSFLDRNKIINKLKKEDLKVEDIDVVILTHLHLDHVFNVNLFKNAKIYCKFSGGNYPGQFHSLKEGYLKRFDLINGKIAEGVSIVETPGHSEDMISVIVETKNGKVVIAGDAISDKEFTDLNKPPILVNNLEEYNKSREKILGIADYIIPGHGRMFKVEK